MSQAAAKAAYVEPEVSHAPPSLGLPNQKFGMWVFIASESMFFAALITTFMVFRNKSVIGPHPQDVVNIVLVTISTFMLLMSSLTMALGVAAAHRGDAKTTGHYLLLTIVGGVIFLGIQGYEWYHLITEFGLTWRHNIFGSIFFILTGFHKAHIIFGMIWLGLLTITAYRGTLKKKHAVNVEVAGLYWHFVDIVWIVVFTVVFLLAEAGV